MVQFARLTAGRLTHLHQSSLSPPPQGSFVLCLLPPVFFMGYMRHLFPKVISQTS